MDIKTLLSKRNFTAMKNKVNRFIVIHYVGAVSSALSNAKYFEKIYRAESAHYFVDDNDVYQVVREKDAAWHCGANYYKHLSCRNSNSIGIEMCCYRNSKGEIDVSEATIEKTVKLVKELMAKYNIPVENVLRHYDVTGKNCPAPFVKNNNRWIDFIVPVKTAYQTENESIVDDSKNQFWVHNSVIENGTIHARAIIAFAQGTSYIAQVFDRQFWVAEDNIVKAL